MIKLEELDKTKTYVGYEVGRSLIAKLIQKLSKKATTLPENEIASHIFVLAYQDNKWFVFESHMRWDGCKKLPYSEWVKDYEPDTIFCVERSLYVGALEFYADPIFNPGYSPAEIAGLALEEIAEDQFWNDNPGMICSEYAAIADMGFKIAYDYKLKCNRIKPVHWQMELINKGKKPSVKKK